MRTRWEDLHHSFDRTARFCGGASFMLEARGQPALDSFTDLHELLAYLLERDGDLATRDRVLAALVLLTRLESTRAVATALLWLALWPGLCGVYARRLRRGATGDEALSAISYAFTTLVAHMDLSRVTRVAATLVRSTERETLAMLRLGAREVSLEEQLTDSILFADGGHELVEARWLVERLLGGDAQLVLAVAVLEETQAEAGERLGLTAAAARKRYQRAVHHARAALAAV